MSDTTTAITPAAFSYANAAEYMGGVSERHIRRLVARGDILAVRVGHRVVIHRADLDAFLAEHRTTGGAA